MGDGEAGTLDLYVNPDPLVNVRSFVITTHIKYHIYKNNTHHRTINRVLKIVYFY